LKIQELVALRIAIPIGKNGGVMKPFINLVKYGLGGHQGNGRQMFSWVHIEDLFRVIQFIIINKGILWRKQLVLLLFSISHFSFSDDNNPLIT